MTAPPARAGGANRRGRATDPSAAGGGGAAPSPTSGMTGTASTRFTFNEFQLQQPRVRMVLSLSDTIGLEYDFVMVKK